VYQKSTCPHSGKNCTHNWRERVAFLSKFVRHTVFKRSQGILVCVENISLNWKIQLDKNTTKSKTKLFEAVILSQYFRWWRLNLSEIRYPMPTKDGKAYVLTPSYQWYHNKMKFRVKGIWGLSGPQPPCWRNQYQTSHVDKISNEAGLS
jgi:hypothetical protein